MAIAATTAARRATLMALAALLLLCATALPAAAHADHEALPDGFRASVAAFVDGAGKPAMLDGVTIEPAVDGGALTVTNTTDTVLQLSGEQANEPLLRVTADAAFVNEASPQAQYVEGADVDPAAAADLLDLVWNRAEPQWVPLPTGGTATVMDHRGAPGHPPVRSEYRNGDEVGTFSVEFAYGRTAYRAQGRIEAVEPVGGGGQPSVPWSSVVAMILAAAVSVAGLVLLRGRHSKVAGGPQPV